MKSDKTLKKKTSKHLKQMNNETEKDLFPHLNPPFSTADVLSILDHEHDFIRWAGKNTRHPKAVAFANAAVVATYEEPFKYGLAVLKMGETARKKR